MNKKPNNSNNNEMLRKNLSKALPILALILLIFAAFSYIPANEKKINEIPLSQAVNEINAGQVRKITAEGSKIKITYLNGDEADSLMETSIGLGESLLNLGVNQEQLRKTEVGFSENKDIWEWLLPILLAVGPSLLVFFFFWSIFRQAKMGAAQTFDFTNAKAKLFGADGKNKEKTLFDDVAGLEEAKEELKEIIDFLKTPEKFFQIGAKIPRGVILVGPPGCGKTLLARAVAAESDVPFFSISGSEFIELFVGVGASRVRSLFGQAKKAQKAIIFIDEIDSIGRAREAGFGGGFEEREQTLNQILAEMDGFERNSEVIVIGATNKPESLDQALLRPGRFDRRIVLDLPDIKDREAILKIHSRGKPLGINVNLREVAERTPGFSGADIASLVNEAAILSAMKDKKEIGQEELLISIEKVMLGPERKSHLLNKSEKIIAAFHEAGHALVASSLPGSEDVRKISIIARGMAAGYTLKMPREERKLRKKSEFMAELAVLFGGYVAEKIKFGEMTTGASDDLKRASQLARKLVKEYGMSSLGPVVFGEREELAFLPGDYPEKRNYSEEIAFAIDKEVAKVIEEGQKKAEEILRQKKELLEKLAQVLIEKETIEKEEFEKIVGKR